MPKTIKQLKNEIAGLERKNKELVERKTLENKLAELKERRKKKKPSKSSIVERGRGIRRKVKSFLGPAGDAMDRAFG